MISIVTSAGVVYACLTITDSQYFSMTTLGRVNLVDTLAPAWLWHFFKIARQVWTWSELAVMMTNRKRRALHDFIAGTVVIFNASGRT